MRSAIFPRQVFPIEFQCLELQVLYPPELHRVRHPVEWGVRIGRDEELDIFESQSVDPTGGVPVNVATPFGVNDEVPDDHIANRARKRAFLLDGLARPFVAAPHNESHRTALAVIPAEAAQVHGDIGYEDVTHKAPVRDQEGERPSCHPR